MSQGGGLGGGGSQQDDMRRTSNKRRSSVIQQAMKEGLVQNGQAASAGSELFNNFPAKLQQNILRVSNGGQGQGPNGQGQGRGSTSFLAGRSLLPLSTPQMQGGRGTLGGPPSTLRGSSRGALKRSAIPTPTNGTGSRVQAKKPQGPPPTVRMQDPSSSRQQSIKPKSNLDKRKSLSLSSVRPQAQSVSFFQTPASRAVGVTPASIRSWGSQNSLTTFGMRPEGGKGKMPGQKDKDKLGAMMVFVHEHVTKLGAEGFIPANPKELHKISTNTYLKLVELVGGTLLGPRFFQPNPKEQVQGKGINEDARLNKILELAASLRYPLPISKSHLKSANAPNSWPTSLTFLAFVCSQSEEAHISEDEEERVLFKDNFHKLAQEHYLKIYMTQCSSKDVLLDELVDQELVLFRQKLAEQFFGESTSTIEQLREERDKQKRELEELEAIPDPLKEINEILEKTNIKINKVHEHIGNLDEQIAFFNNIQTLLSQQNSLQMELTGKEAELLELREWVRAQPMDKVTADKMKGEVKEIRKQLEILRKMNQTLKMDLEGKKDELEGLEEQFRSSVSKFTVIEAFNSSLSCFDAEDLSVRLNPLTPEEMEEWLQGVEKIQGKANEACHEWLSQLSKDGQKLSEMVARLDKDFSTGKLQLAQKKAMSNHCSRLFGAEEEEKSRELQEKRREDEDAAMRLEETQEELETVVRRFHELEQKLKEIEEKKNELEKRVDRSDWIIEKKHEHYSGLEAKHIQKFLINFRGCQEAVRQDKEAIKRLYQQLKGMDKK